MNSTFARRTLLKAATGSALLAAGVARAQSQPTPTAQPWANGTRLVLLGTMAGPVLHPSRMMSSQAVFVNGRGFLVDCGYGTIARMTEMGMRLGELSHILVTHHHSDHTADYPALLNLAWILGIKGQLGIYGPPPMLKMHQAALAVFEEDTDIRIAATRREPVAKSFQVREVSSPGLVHEDSSVKITAALADHAPFEVALAYRFDTAERSIVISGDTAQSDAVARLARGADVLVHEAMYEPSIEQMLAKRPYVPPTLREFLRKGHTSAEDAGRVAAQAGVKTLVLSHLLPGDEPVADSVWIDQASKHFKGEIIVGRDKMVL
ncbi:MBL fold metallo-hydrolase [Variovorax sp. HJSM1_2]|uniref:MBL fold metallo-hydrolase n=1 Tax=Variovorax sp. HJSM1_2 TaxID=3366263 RepID=UPI003BE2C380